MIKAMKLKTEKSFWKKLGWGAIVFFIIKGTITTSGIIYMIWWGTK